MGKIRTFIEYIQNQMILFRLRREKKLYGLRKSIIKGAKYFNFTKVYFQKRCRIECYDHYNREVFKPKLIIGENTFFQYQNTILCSYLVKIGSNCLFGSNILITDENHGHELDGTPFYEQPLVRKEVTIGDNCWCGDNVIILPGVNIGNNTVIGGGSVVTKSFPSECIIAGNPARIIKNLKVHEG